MLDALELTPCMDVAGQLRTQILRTRYALRASKPDASGQAHALAKLAARQRSRPGAVIAGILTQIASRGDLGAEITQLAPPESCYLSMVAEELAGHLARLGPSASAVVLAEARARPARWRTALRLALELDAKNRSAATLLVEVGIREDLELLRSLSSSNATFKMLAANLARRLAQPVLLHDLGAVSLLVGDKPTERPVRRKVLAFLCLLASKPNMLASRDEALDALWPDLGPDAAANSLHQTIYFLRRIIEPDFKEGFGAGYVSFDGEVVSLNPELFDSSSRRCWRLLAESRRSGSRSARLLLDLYFGRFAVDFLYEEWATDYAVLSTVEAEIRAALGTGDYDEAIDLAQSLLAIDPGADTVELALLKAYKLSNRRAAAAEQYAHYATVMREQLGVTPPSLDEL